MSKKEVTNAVKNYLLKHPIDRTKSQPYKSAADKFGVSEERIRNAWRSLRNSNQVENTPDTAVKPYITYNASADEDTYSESNDKVQINKTVEEKVKSLDDLIKVCNIDTDKWNVESWECKRYNSWIKKDEEIYNEPRYSVSAKLKKISLDSDLKKQQKVLLEEIKEILSKEQPKVKIKDYEPKEGLLLEISAPDLHLGKLSWAAESGEDYDIKIACKRYKDAIYTLLGRVPLDMIEKILLPIGNDMITIDSKKNTTTAGTYQDSDSRFRKMLTVAKDLIIEVVNELVKIAPVDIVVVSGNHDYDSMFTVGMVLEAYYHNHPYVNINNEPTQRKYYQYFSTGIQFTHGDEEPHRELGLIFATEQSKLWANTQFRFCQLGHFHKNKKTNYLSVDDYQGFQIQVLPSLSGTDAWHNTKGYNSLKQAKAFLFDREEGLIGEFTYTVKK